MAETYVVVLRRVDEVPVDEEHAVSWLCAVARRALANVRRSARRAAALTDRLQADQGRVDILELDADRVVAAESWWSLSPDDRVILSLVGLQGFSLKDLAALLGCSVLGAASRVSRARARLATQEPA